MSDSVDNEIKRIKALNCFDGLTCAIERIFLGLSHHCFVVTSVNVGSQKSTKYFVKSLSLHTLTEKNERVVAQSAAASKVSPHVIFHSQDWLVTEYIEGYTLFESQYLNEDKIYISMKLLHDFHQLPVLEEVTTLSIKVLIDEQIKINSFSEEQKIFLINLNKAICNFNQSPISVICHGDLNFSNILIDKQAKAWLIDYECAAIGCAEYDIAMFMAINSISSDYLSYVFQCYQGKNKQLLEPKLVQSYLACCHLINGLWYQDRASVGVESEQYIALAYQQYYQFDLLNISEDKLVEKLL